MAQREREEERDDNSPPEVGTEREGGRMMIKLTTDNWYREKKEGGTGREGEENSLPEVGTERQMISHYIVTERKERREREGEDKPFPKVGTEESREGGRKRR